MAEATATIAEVTGRPARFENETLEQAYRSRARWNPEPWQADAWVSTYTADRQRRPRRGDRRRRAPHRAATAVPAAGAAGASQVVRRS